MARFGFIHYNLQDDVFDDEDGTNSNDISEKSERGKTSQCSENGEKAQSSLILYDPLNPLHSDDEYYEDETDEVSVSGNDQYDALPVTAKFPEGRPGIMKIFKKGRGKREFSEFENSEDVVESLRSDIRQLVAYKSIPSRKSKENDFLRNLSSKGIDLETFQRYLCSGISSRTKKKCIFLFNNPVPPGDYVGSIVNPVFIQIIPLDQSSQTYFEELLESLLVLQGNSSTSSISIQVPSVLGKRKQEKDESLRQTESVDVSSISKRSVFLSTLRENTLAIEKEYKDCCLQLRENRYQLEIDPRIPDITRKAESIAESFAEIKELLSSVLAEAIEIESFGS